MDFINSLDSLMYEITVKLKDDIKFSTPVASTDGSTDESDFNKIIDAVKVKFVYDSIILTLPLSDINIELPKYDTDKTIFHRIDSFFSMMATMSTLFICTTGYVLRGGISIGKHYETERENYLFIFSEAHNEAVKLEEAAEFPRIILDNNSRMQLDKMLYPNMDKFFYNDIGGCYCFDIYSKLHILPDIPQVLTGIRTAVMLNMESNAGDKEVLSKLIYYAKYHNQKVSKDGFNVPASVIDIGKFEKY